MTQNQPENAIEVDSEGVPTSGDEDSIYGSGYSSDLTSLNTAAKSHTFENGRRFHGFKEGKYTMPNDETEQDRMDLYHHLALLILKGELVTAPIQDKSIQRILDLGTGTGIWSIDAGDAFPSAEVFGVDLSAIQPSWVPPNVRFEVDDMEAEWTWPDNNFDYIHLRNLAGFLEDWPRLLRQAYRCLKPGGYIELQDLTDFYHSDDDSIPQGNVLQQWPSLLDKATQMQGREWLRLPSTFKKGLETQGFVEINEQSHKVPLGAWPKDERLKEIGKYARWNMYDGAEAFTLASFTRTLGWELENVAKFVEDVKKEMMNPRIHATERFYCIYGRKP